MKRNIFLLVVSFLVLGWLLNINFRLLAQTTVPSPTPSHQVSLPELPESILDIQDLMNEMGNECQLPCFWGIRPGYTTETQINEFLEPTSIGNNAPELIFRFPKDREEEPTFYLSLGIEDEIVSDVSVIIYNPSEWLPDSTVELPNLLSTMPSVPRGYMSINLTQQRIFLTVAYDDGVLAQYPFRLRVGDNDVVSPDSDEPFLFCPDLDENAFIRLGLSDEDAQSMLEEFGTLSGSRADSTWTVERMTGFKINEFTMQIIDNPDSCIQLPSYSKLLEMGYEF